MSRLRELNWPLLLAALALAAAHLGLVHYFFGGELDDRPFSRGDFATHATQTRRFITALDEFGRAWVYDPQLLAGAPNGVLFDADVKAWELWTWALTRLGVDWGRAYNGFVLAVHLSVPAIVYAAARIARLDRPAALIAASLGVGLWFFDSFIHWMWFIGTVTYSAAGVFALLPLALFYRWIEDRRPLVALACALALALGHLLHPYIFFILVGPMLALYLRAGLIERSLSWAEHAMTWGVAASCLLANLWWLVLALRFVHYLLDSAHYNQGGIQYLVYDLFGLVDDPGSQGMIAPRTGLRLAVVLAGIFGLRAWGRSGDRRRLPFLVTIVALAVLTYLGSYTFLAQIQPYRHNLPLAFALVLPAAAWLRALPARRPWRSMQPGARGLALILAALALVHLSRDVLYFFAGDMRERRTLEDGREVVMNTMGHIYIPPYRYTEQERWASILARVEQLDKKDGSRGRWLVQDQVFGEYVMAMTDAQVLGGFELRNIEHSDAHWVRRAGRYGPYEVDELRDYLETYAVRWILIRQGDHNPWWDQHPQLMTRAGFADEIIIYKVHRPVSLLDGPGELEVGLNRLAVTGSDPEQDLLLRFHWLETLRCAPGCEIERVEVPGDRVGFMRVPAPHPADFSVENSYRFE